MGSLTKAFFMNSGGAATVPSGVILGWAGTNASIPTGYTRATAYDGRFVKMIPNSSTNPGGTGGSGSHNHPYGSHSDHGVATHSHTYTGSTGCSGGAPICRPNAAGSVAGNHNHTAQSGSASTTTVGAGGPANYNCATAEPPNLVVIFIKSSGTHGVPGNALAFYNGSAPTGWTQYANGSNRVWKGAATGGDGGATGGTGCAHSHSSAAHTHSVSHTHSLTASSFSGSAQTGGCGTSYTCPSHTHTGTASYSCGASSSVSECTASGDVTPPWTKMMTIQNGATESVPTSGIIAIWDGTIASIPAKWKLCDGIAGTPNLSNGNFVRGAATSAEVGTTGGASTHTHSGSGHSHTNATGAHTHGAVTLSFNGSVSKGPPPCGCFAGQVIGSHTHSGTASCSATANALGSRTTNASANSSNSPLYTEVAYIQYTG